MKLFQSDLIYSSQNLKANSVKIEWLGLAPRKQKKNTTRNVVGRIKYTLFCGRRGTDQFTSIMITQPESNVGVLYEDINGKKMQSGKI